MLDRAQRLCPHKYISVLTKFYWQSVIIGMRLGGQKMCWPSSVKVMKVLKNLRLSTLVLLGAGTLFLAGAALVSVAIQTSKNVSVVESSWKEYQVNRSEKARLESVLRASIGYGGMIHEFKNFILRQDASRIDLVQEHSGGAKAVIAQYSSLGTTPAEAVALQDILKVLKKYDAALILARNLVDEGQSPEQVDTVVQIDDGPALRGLEILRREVEAQMKIGDIEAGKGRIAATLRAEIGFGGMIHEFKNFVLRQDMPRVEIVHEKLRLAAAAIDRYQALGPTEAEKLALEDIRETLGDYEVALHKAEKLAREKKLPGEVDREVKVDDELALRGLAVIDKEIAYQAEESSRDVTESLARATNLLGIATWGTVILVSFVTITLSWTMRSMVILPIQHMTHLMTRLAANRVDVEVPATRQRNEIGEMARAIEVFRENAIKRRIAEEEIRQMTLMDGLTGVANRKRFDTRLHEIVQLCRRMDITAALLMIDLDGFKAVNDVLGHHAGDEVLKVAAERMLHVTREVDIVARLGGDEFAIILLGMDSPEDAEIPARRLIEDIERVTVVDDVDVKISASIGIRMLSPVDEDIDMIMRQADAAMYTVKRSGRGHYAFFGQKPVIEDSFTTSSL